MAAESHSTAMRKAVGTNVEDQLQLLGGYLRAGTERCTVKLPPGLAKLATKPWPTGSPVAAITIGTQCLYARRSQRHDHRCTFHFSDPSSVAELMRHAGKAHAAALAAVSGYTFGPPKPIRGFCHDGAGSWVFLVLWQVRRTPLRALCFFFYA